MKYTLSIAKEDDPIYKAGFTISSIRRTPDNANKKKEVTGNEKETTKTHTGQAKKLDLT